MMSWPYRTCFDHGTYDNYIGFNTPTVCSTVPFLHILDVLFVLRKHCLTGGTLKPAPKSTI